jgi:Cytochrome C oxidase, cbb3-type, subunit III
MTVHTPIETSPGLPRWAIGLTVLVFLVGGAFFAGNLSGQNPPITGQASPPGPGGGGGGGGRPAQAIIADAGCQQCHGQDLTGGVGPNLHGVKEGPESENLQDLAQEHPEDWANLWIEGTDPAVADLDRQGMPVFGGPPYNLSPEEIATVVDYLKSLQ